MTHKSAEDEYFRIIGQLALARADSTFPMSLALALQGITLMRKHPDIAQEAKTFPPIDSCCEFLPPLCDANDLLVVEKLVKSRPRFQYALPLVKKAQAVLKDAASIYGYLMKGGSFIQASVGATLGVSQVYAPMTLYLAAQVGIVTRTKTGRTYEVKAGPLLGRCPDLKQLMWLAVTRRETER